MNCLPQGRQEVSEIMRNIPIIIPYFTEDEAGMVAECLKSGWVAQGPRVAEFEKQTAAYEGTGYGIATTSCTTALHLVMAAMGLHKGQDVLVPSYTFVATANAVEYTGATAVLVDVTTDTYCIDTNFLASFIEERYVSKDGFMVNKITGNRLFGVVAVNLFGICADIPAVNAIAKRYAMHVIEDSACALGASINGVHEGAFGNPSCLSFHARKSITTGEGGMVLTADRELAEKVRRLRSHGASVSEVSRHQNHGFLLPEYRELGYNYRMTDIQGAVGQAQLKKFDYILEKRREKSARYDRLLPQCVPFLQIPYVPAGYYHTYQSYVTMLDYKKLGFSSVEEGNDFRNRWMAYLEDHGVSTRQGTHAVHTLGYYKEKYGYQPSDLPGAYACDRLSLALPLYVELSEDDQDYVLEQLEKGAKAVR